MEEPEEEQENRILCLSFNQENTLFAIGTLEGFAIFTAYPFEKTYQHSMKGGIGFIELLSHSNLVALVGSTSNGEFKDNTLYLWDQKEENIISSLSFQTPIKNIKLKRDIILIVLEEYIYILELATFQQKEKIKTAQNPKGVISITSNIYINVIAYPDIKDGYVKVQSFDEETKGCSVIKAHNNKLGCIQLNNVAKYLATTSILGTVIRIIDLETSLVVMELRRGTEKAEIFSLCFDFFSKFLTCTSDRGTVHIFSIENLHKSPEELNVENGVATKNQKSSWMKLSSWFSYFNSEWSFAQFRITDPKSLCVFAGNTNNRLVVISSEWKYYECGFDVQKGGECEVYKDVNIELEFE